MLTLTVRPVSTSCNASCGYCYLGDQTKIVKSLMVDDTLKTLISSYQNDRDYCRYVWHGGEPTMAGLDFYEKAMFYQEKYTNKKNSKIRNSIQTNGYNIDNNWIDFFLKNKFDIGISLDGDKSINDFQRGKKSFKRTIRAIKLLQEAEINFSIICVVTQKNITDPDLLFKFFIDHGLKSVSFNPIFGEHEDFDIEPSDFSVFMRKIYDLWVRYDDPSIHIRFIKETVLGLLGGTIDLCMMQGGCNNHLIIESDGRVFPCHTFEDTTPHIGNIHYNNFEELSAHNYFQPAQVKVDERCNECRWYNLCGGDCVRFLEYEKDIFYGTPFCYARKEIFSHIENDLIEKEYISLKHSGSGRRYNFEKINSTPLSTIPIVTE